MQYAGTAQPPFRRNGFISKSREIAPPRRLLYRCGTIQDVIIVQCILPLQRYTVALSCSDARTWRLYHHFRTSSSRISYYTFRCKVSSQSPPPRSGCISSPTIRFSGCTFVRKSTASGMHRIMSTLCSNRDRAQSPSTTSSSRENTKTESLCGISKAY